MRLIDADDLIAHTFKNDISYKAFVNLVKKQQIVEERKTGKWEVTGERKFVALDGSAEKQYRELGYPHHNVLNMRCSNCNKTTMVDASIAYGYCPHCGARMGEAEEGEKMAELKIPIVVDWEDIKNHLISCKDCKYFREGSHIYPFIYQCWRTTFYGNPVIYPTTPDDFCSRGERREDNDIRRESADDFSEPRNRGCE